jgi:hypothetical protein
LRKARFTEHQIIAVLKSVEAGRAVKDICREACVFEASYLTAQFAKSYARPAGRYR